MIENNVLQSIKTTGVAYDVIEIDPDYADTYNFCEKYKYPMKNSANTIIVRSKKKPVTFAAAVVSASKKLDVNHTLKELMNSGRISFAKPEETERLTGMTVGGVTVLGLTPSINTYADKGLLDLDYIILGGGGRSTKIIVSPIILTKLENVKVVDHLTI